MSQTFYCSHQLGKLVWYLKTNMSSAVALVVFPLLLQSVLATFPPVQNPPPIPSQAVRTVDISGQRFYLQDDLQPNQPQNVIKEDGYISSNDKIDSRWFAPENQSGETGDFPNNDETFDRYYANGLPAVGPVATPLPDDNYVAQPSVTSKVLPDGPANVGSSDIWVLTKGPNDQLIPERWVQVQIPQIQVPQIQVPQDRIVEVVKSDVAPKQYTENVKSFASPFPSLPSPVKAPVAAPPPSVVQQIWVRAPVPVQSPKVVQNTDTFVEDIPSVKQIVDIPPPTVKQYVQPQIIKEAQPLPPPPPPPPPAVVQKSSSFVLPPPPPPPIKGTDFTSPKQTVVVNQPVAPPPVVGDQVVTIGKNIAVPQVKHIWIPTSPQTGKFITVPVGANIDAGKSVPSKGVPVDVSGPPISVSETWVLKQDGFLPRFVEQKTPVPVIQKGTVIVDNNPKIQFDSPPNPPLVGKSIDAAVPLDIWPSKNVPEQAVVGKFAAPPPPPPPVFPSPVAVSVKSDAVVISKASPIVPPPQKTIMSSVKGLPQLPPSFPPPPPQIIAPVPQIINGKPCPISPQKFTFPSKTLPMPAFRTVSINRPPLGRIVRINRYPYGSYYVLNQRISPSLYPYPRPPVIQQNKNGVVRLIPANQVAVPLQQRQLAIPVARKQVVVPVSNVKSAAPVLLYPPVNRIRYAYPWGSYIRSLPVTAGKNIFILPPNKPAKIQAAKKSSSSESSSSESSSSESKSVEIKPKSKEAKKSEEIKAESIENVESEEIAPEPEPEPEREIEDVETAASEAEPETEEAPVESEANDSIEVEESQVQPQFLNRAYIDSNTDNLGLIRKPFLFNLDQRDTSATTQYRKEVSDTNGKVIGSYGYHNADGIYKKVAYVSDADGYRAQLVSNEPGTVNHNSANVNLISKVTPENTTNRISEIPTAASHENLTVDPQRD